MRVRPVALFLLLAFTFGFAAGPHPCHAAKAPSQPAVEEHASCHAAKPAPEPEDPREDDCCDPVGGQDLCKKACQVVAVLGTEPLVAGVRFFQDLSLEPAARFLPSFVFPIDHIPLS